MRKIALLLAAALVVSAPLVAAMPSLSYAAAAKAKATAKAKTAAKKGGGAAAPYSDPNGAFFRALSDLGNSLSAAPAAAPPDGGKGKAKVRKATAKTKAKKTA